MIEQTLSSRAGDKTAGAMLIAAAVLSIAAMAHHPSGASGHGGLARLVHGTLIGLAFVLLTGFGRFAARRGWQNLAVMAGFILFTAGVCGAIIAALINGFVVPELYDRDHISPDISALCWELNQAFAYVSAFAMSGAFALWGADLLMRGVAADRLLGLGGLLAGILPATLLATGVLNLQVAGALMVYAAQWTFSAAVGLWMLNQRR